MSCSSLTLSSACASLRTRTVAGFPRKDESHHGTPSCRLLLCQGRRLLADLAATESLFLVSVNVASIRTVALCCTSFTLHHQHKRPRAPFLTRGGLPLSLTHLTLSASKRNVFHALQNCSKQFCCSDCANQADSSMAFPSQCEFPEISISLYREKERLMWK